MKGVGEGAVGIIALADAGQQLQKRAALEKADGIDPLLLVHAEDQLPVRVAAADQLLQRRVEGFIQRALLRPLLLGKAVMQDARVAKAQRVVQKHLGHARHVRGQLVDELAPALRLVADDPQHELMLGQIGNQLVHPCGYAAVNIGIAAFQHTTDFHCSFHHISTWGRVASTSPSEGDSSVSLPPSTRLISRPPTRT